MLIGVCCPVTEAAQYAQLGFDYFEPALSQVGALSAADWADWLTAARQAGLPALVMNVMLPGHFRLTGPDADHPAALTWLDAAFARAAQAGTTKIVFGSGGARNRPDGTDLATGLAQLTAFSRELATLAARHGLSIGLEALRSAESNILTTQAEAAAFVKTIDNPAFGL
ncbi:MAG: TIM barrel protein, partial [Bacillota bacterium]|nr:TIM barrel protein [Bacillota bacterium]